MFLCTCIHTCSNTYTNAHSCMCVGRYTPAYHDSTTSMVHVTYPNSTKCGSAPCAWDNVTPTHTHTHTTVPNVAVQRVTLDSGIVHSYICCTCFLQRHHPRLVQYRVSLCSHVTLCAKAICTGTSAHVVSTLSTNCHPANVLCVACVSAQGNDMSANLPPGRPGLLPAGL